MIIDDSVATDSQALVKQKEIQRSKEYRELVNSLLEEINHCVSDGKLKKNSILETAVAVLKLNSFYKYNNKKSYCPVSLDDILKSKNSMALGIGFLESGIILYTTDQLKCCFKDTKNLSGLHLSEICLNSSQILNRVFNEKENDFVLCMINSKPKMVSDIYVKGKLMCNREGAVMFLGITTIENQCKASKNPSQSMIGCYMIGNPQNMIYESASRYMTFLLGSKVAGTDVGKFAHPDIMEDMSKQLVQLKKKGFLDEFPAKMLTYEADGSSKCLYVLLNIRMFQSVRGLPLMAILCIPYAISEDILHNGFSMDDLKLLNDNPTTAADIKMKTRVFKKALINREGIFGDTSKRKTIITTHHGKPESTSKNKVHCNSTNGSGFASQDTSYPTQVQNSLNNIVQPFVSSNLVPQTSFSQVLPIPAPSSQKYDIILHQTGLEEKVLLQNVESTYPVIPQTVQIDTEPEYEINVVD